MVGKTVFVAEFTTNHMGNLNLLLRMVEKASECGVSYIKMQKKDVNNYYSKEKLNSRFVSPYGQTYGEYRTLFEFDDLSFNVFDRRCKELNIQWFSTVQDIASLHWMLKWDLDLYKISSSSARDIEFVKEINNSVPKNKEIVMSVAGLTLREIEDRISLLSDYKLHILHCVAEYPTRIEFQKLGNISILREHFEGSSVSIGYSGHEVGYIPSLAAVAMGAKMIERHFTLSRDSFVHHIECALLPHEFKEMIYNSSRENLQSSIERMLPPVAFESSFGMSDMEKAFLIEKTYGDKYIHG